MDAEASDAEGFIVPLFTASKDKSEVKAVGRRLPFLHFTAWKDKFSVAAVSIHGLSG